MTSANREILEKKKNILRNVYQYEKFNDIPREVLLHTKLTYKVTEEFILRIFSDYKSGHLHL